MLMRKILGFAAFLLAAFTLTLVATPSQALETGAPVPKFVVKDSTGKTHQLSDFKGKYVVLQWSNYGCPFDKKHYESNNMQMLQKNAGGDVVWLTVFSSAPGKQGHVTADEANDLLKKRDEAPTAAIMDEDGDLARMFNAKTTPHMFLIDKFGVLAYQGAIDDDSSANPSATQGAHNYVMAALADLRDGKPVTVPETRPYGCSIKFR